MSLSVNDLQNIRGIVREENEAYENDIKEIYRMLFKSDKKLKRLTKDVSILTKDVSIIARQTGVQLPRHSQ